MLNGTFVVAGIIGIDAEAEFDRREIGREGRDEDHEDRENPHVDSYIDPHTMGPG